MGDFENLKYNISRIATIVKCCKCNKIIPKSIDLPCKHFCCDECFKIIENKCPACNELVEKVIYDENIEQIRNLLNKLCEDIKTNYNVDSESLFENTNFENDLNPENTTVLNESNLDVLKPINDNKKVVRNKRKSSLNESNKSITDTKKTKNKSIKDTKDKSIKISKNKSITETTVVKNTRSSRKSKENVEKIPVTTKNYKTEVVHWLNSNKNDFDRITQTQQALIIDDVNVEGTTPSISQLNNSRITRKSTRKTNTKTRCRSLEIQVKKPRKKQEQRHSVCSEIMDKENYNIDDINTDEINEIVKQAEVKVIENLLQDEYLDRLESEMLNINNEKHDNNKGVEDESTTSSGWDRIKDISKKISKKEKKKLNVTLEPVNQTQVSQFKPKTAFVELMDISKDPNIDLSNVNLAEKEKNTIHHMEILNLEKKADDSVIVNNKSSNSVNENDIHIILETYSSNEKDKENITETSQDIENKSVNLNEDILTNVQQKLKEAISMLTGKSFNKNTVLKKLKECEDVLKNTPPVKSYAEKCVQVTQETNDKNTQTYLDQKTISIQTENVELLNKSLQTDSNTNKKDSSQILLTNPIDNMIITSQELMEGIISPKQINIHESDEIISHKKSSKRPMIIDSDDSEDNITKKPCLNRFTKSNLSIKFESQVEEKKSDDRLNLSENIDYDDYLAKIMKKYDDSPNSSQIINPVSVSSGKKPNEEKTLVSAENKKLTQTKISQLSKTPSSSKFEDENYFDDCCITNIDNEIEKFKTSKQHNTTQLSDIISETEDIQPLKKLKRVNTKKEKNVAASAEKNLDSDFENYDIEIDEDELVEIEKRANENKKINVLQEIVVKNHVDQNMDEGNETPSMEYFENEDNMDIIEATPPRKESRVESQNFSQIPQFSTLEMAAFDEALPPPAEFCDNEEINKPNPTLSQTNLNDSLFVRSPKITRTQDMSRTSTPQHSRYSKPELHFSPIFSSQSSKIISQTPKSSKIISQTPKSSMLSCIPGQRSIFNYFNNPSQKKSGTSTDLDNNRSFREKPLVTSTRIDKDQMIGISTLAHRKIITYSATFTENVTHLIANVDRNNYVEEHTMKFILAVASGAWVLNVDWIKECLEKNRIVPEAPYEVLDGSGIAGPKISRLTRKSSPLFGGFKFCCRPPFQSAVKQDVETVLRLLGGIVESDVSTMGVKDGLHAIIVSEIIGTQDFDIYEKMLEKYKCVTVDLEWISKSVAQYRLTSVRPYLLCSEDSISQLGYPQALLDFVPLTGTEDE